MGFLSLFWGSSDSSANCPNWFVSNDDLRPVSDLLSNDLKMLLAHLHGVSSFSLFKKLSNAVDDAESSIQSLLDLLANELIRFAKDMSPL